MTERGDSDRGQTVIDYAVAAGVFFIAVVFVLGFIPGMFAPFSGQDNSLVADRLASSLGTDTLGDPDTPYTLETACTWHFFNQIRNDVDTTDTCRYNTTSDELPGALGFDELLNANVTIETLDGSIPTLTHDGSDVKLAAGDDVPASTSVTTARRVVRLDGNTYRLLVRVW